MHRNTRRHAGTHAGTHTHTHTYIYHTKQLTASKELSDFADFFSDFGFVSFFTRFRGTVELGFTFPLGVEATRALKHILLF